MKKVLIQPSVTKSQRTRFIAEPFFVDQNRIAFEILTHDPLEKYIGTAVIEGQTARYLEDVIREPDSQFSFPYTFEFDGDKYCVPERTKITSTGKKSFPTIYRVKDAGLWEIVHQIDVPGVDPAIFCHGGLWYLVCSRGYELNVFFSDHPLSNYWQPHPANPVSTGPRCGRLGGRPVYEPDDELIFFYQDGSNHYGEMLHAYRITELSPTVFTQMEHPASPVASAQYNGKWNSHGMHHADFDLANKQVIVDGHTLQDGWSLLLVRDVEGVRRLFPAKNELPVMNKIRRALFLLQRKRASAYRKLKRKTMHQLRKFPFPKKEQ